MQNPLESISVTTSTKCPQTSKRSERQLVLNNRRKLESQTRNFTKHNGTKINELIKEIKGGKPRTQVLMNFGKVMM